MPKIDPDIPSAGRKLEVLSADAAKTACVTPSAPRSVLGRILRKGRQILVDRKLAVWIGNFGAIFLRFVQNILIARLAGPEQMGVFVALTAYSLVFSRIADLGLPTSLIYYMRMSRETSRRCLEVCLIHGFFVLLVALLLFFSVPNLGLSSDVVGQNINACLFMLAVMVAAVFLETVLGQMLVPLDAYRSYAIVMFTSPLVMIIGVLIRGKGLDSVSLVVSLMTGEVCAAAVAIALMARAVRSLPTAKTKLSLRAIYEYALKTYVGTTMKVLALRADKIVLSMFVSPAALAAYALATSMRDNAMQPVNTHAMLLRNHLIDVERKPDGRRLSVLYLRRDCRRWAIVSFGIAVTLIVLCPVLVPLMYGQSFMSAVNLFMVIGLGLPMLSVSGLCWTGLLSSRRPGMVSVGMALTGAINLLALYVGVRNGSIMLAAWLLLGSMCAMSVVWGYISLRLPNGGSAKSA